MKFIDKILEYIFPAWAFIKTYWKIIVGVLSVLVIFYAGWHAHGIVYDAAKARELAAMQKQIEAKTQEYQKASESYEAEIAKLREFNNATEEGMKNETEKDPLCSDRPMPATRVQFLQNATKN